MDSDNDDRDDNNLEAEAIFYDQPLGIDLDKEDEIMGCNKENAILLGETPVKTFTQDIHRGNSMYFISLCYC